MFACGLVNCWVNSRLYQAIKYTKGTVYNLTDTENVAFKSVVKTLMERIKEVAGPYIAILKFIEITCRQKKGVGKLLYEGTSKWLDKLEDFEQVLYDSVLLCYLTL